VPTRSGNGNPSFAFLVPHKWTPMVPSTGNRAFCSYILGRPTRPRIYRFNPLRGSERFPGALFSRDRSFLAKRCLAPQETPKKPVSGASWTTGPADAYRFILAREDKKNRKPAPGYGPVPAVVLSAGPAPESPVSGAKHQIRPGFWVIWMKTSSVMGGGGEKFRGSKIANL
jgi:hypothetical protein